MIFSCYLEQDGEVTGVNLPSLCPSWQKLRGGGWKRGLVFGRVSETVPPANPKGLQWNGACPRVGQWVSQRGSPDRHVCPGRGVELGAEEVGCRLGWTPGQVRCGQVCDRLRERPLRCGAWGLLSVQVALYQKPGGRGAKR